jgi:chlorophyllide a reductase subunit X
MPGERWGSLFEGLASNVATAPPVRPKPLTQDQLLGLFKSDQVGGGIVLKPASQADMRGANYVEKPSLEVIYDAV